MKKYQEKRPLFRSLFSLVLVLTLLVGISSHFGFSAEAASGEDLSARVNLVLTGLQVKKYDDTEGKYVYKDIVKNAERLDSVTEIFRNEDAIIVYNFKVEGRIQVGDYFTFNLPPGEILKGSGITVPLRDKGKVIGSFSVKSDGSARVDFAEGSENGLQNGVLGLKGYFAKESSDFPLSFGNPPKTYHFEIKHPAVSGDVMDFDPGRYSNSTVTSTFDKWGWSQKDGSFIYNISVNDVESSKIFKSRIAGTEPIKRVKNVYIYDELPDGMIYNLDGTVDGYPLIDIKVILYAPAYQGGVIMKDGFHSDPHILSPRPFSQAEGEKRKVFYSKTKDPVTDQRKVFLTLDWSRGQDTWENFKAYIDAQPAPIVGIWKDSKMYAKLGTFPYEHINYEDIFDKGEKGLKEDLDTLVKGGKISSEQKEMMEKAYIGQNIIGFVFDYRTFAKGFHKEKYVNTAVRQVNSGEIESRERVVTLDLGWAWGNLWKDGATNTIEVEKKWLGTPGASVEVELYDENDGQVLQTITLTDDGSGAFKGSFPGLTKQRNGEDARYRVREKSVKDAASLEIKDRYKTVISSDKNTMKINILNIEKTNFKVKKRWITHDNQPIVNPPEDADIYLYEKDALTPATKDGTPFHHQFSISDFDANGEAEFTFEGLLGFRSDGTDIEYEARERNVPEGFTSTGTWDAGTNTYVITNQMKDPALARRTISVEKIWLDENGKRIRDVEELNKLSEITVGIYKNDSSNESNKVDEIKLNGANHWEAVFEVNVYDETKALIEYKVKELTDLSEGYDVTVSGDMKDGFEIYNRRKSTALSVTKLWKNEKGEDVDASTFEDIEVEVYRDDTGSSDGIKLVNKAFIGYGNGWYHEFEKLPLVDGLKKIVYTIKEVAVKDYVTVVKKSATGYDFEVINQKSASLGGGYLPPSDGEITPEDPKKEDSKEEDPKPEEPKKEEPKTPEVPSTDDPNVIPNLPIPSLPIITVPDDNTPQAPPVVPMDDPEGDVVTETPPVPPSIPIVAEEIPELILDEDDVPLGDTEIEYDENGKLKKPSDKKSGEKRTLAKSGGLQTNFIYTGILFSILLILFMGIWVYDVKKKSLKK